VSWHADCLPLLTATVVATVTSRLFGSASVYEAELQRRGLTWQLTLEGRQVTSGSSPKDAAKV
jgi:H+/Cl- antiporter ClcA